MYDTLDYLQLCIHNIKNKQLIQLYCMFCEIGDGQFATPQKILLRKLGSPIRQFLQPKFNHCIVLIV